MSIARKILMGAAGAGSKTTYVDDVFSTYLYTGTSNSQRIDNGLKLGNANAGNSVYFGGFGDGSDYLQMAHSTDLCFGNGDFTIECWAYAAKHDGWNGIFGNWGGAGSFGYVLETVSGDLEFYWYNAAGSYTLVQGAAVPLGQWSHLCVCRSGNTLRVFVNGTMYGSGVSMTEGIRDGTTDFTIGGRVAGGGWWDGNITNLRITKGQGLYTSNFTPSTEPFTTTSQGATASNVKLLCCNKDTVTGSTVTPGTITAFGSPAASNFGTGTASDGEGGLTWLKARTQNYDNWLFDTTRATNLPLRSNNNNAASDVGSTYFNSFNNNGFTVGSNGSTNYTGVDFASWSFLKKKGFFDIVTWSGNSTGGRQIAHNLGSVPGCIMIKNTNNTQNWQVYNRGIGAGSAVFLDLNYAKQTGAQFFNNTEPTSTHFTLGTDCMNNCSGYDYVAYVFAGGKGTTDKAVEFDGTDDYLTVASSSDLTMGTGDFTIECWLNKTAQTHKGVWQISGSTTGLETNNYGDTIALGYQSGVWQIYGGGGYQNSASYPIVANKWYHAAYVRSSGTSKLYIDGVEVISRSDTTNYAGTYMAIGGYYSINYLHNGRISNLRVVKGQALYTSNFSVPHDPYTTTSHGVYSGNTKLLCCNGSTTTASTITPATITATGNPTVTTNNSIFDDTEANVFGEGGDQNLVKCGSYTTDSNEDADVYLGWEPSWVLVKRTDSASGGPDWMIVDSMRGFPNAQDVEDNASSQCKVLEPNTADAEATGARLGLTPTGFYADQYGANRSYVYMAIRRPDPLVGKPPEVGTDVFAMDVGDNNSTIPEWYSEFPVDFGFFKATAANQDWYLSARLVQAEVLYPNATNDEDGYGDAVFDSNLGWGKSASGVYGTAYQSWMWKRYAGMDVVTYGGNQVSREVRHNLGRVPEMIWSKDRTDNSDWIVYHKGLNGGTNPATKFLYLNKPDAENGWVVPWNDTEPTSLWYPVQASTMFNKTGNNYLTMLFASVEGISKVGYYTGTGNNQSVTTGFRPRFILIKRTSYAEDWFIFDSLRGLVSSSSDPYLRLNDSAAQVTTASFFDISSTGFTVTANFTNNANNYIYYAHA